MPLIIIILSIFSFITASPKYLVTYDLKFRINREAPEKFNRTSLRLFISPESSIYLDQALYYEFTKGERKSPISKAPILHISYKDYKTQKVRVSQTFMPKNIGFEQKMMVNSDWKLSSEKKKFNQYNCQKATTVYGGREWVAWFTRDLPLSEGPYVFSGLPGLIVKLESADNDFLFELKEINSLKDTEVIPRLGKVELVSREKFQYFLKNKSNLAYQQLNTIVGDLEMSKNGKKQSKDDIQKEFKNEDRRRIEIEYKK